MDILASDKKIAVVGLGLTGMSCVRYLTRKGRSFVVMDSRADPPGLSELRHQHPDVPVAVGGFRQDWLADADEIWLSPGVALDHPEIRVWRDQKFIRGDVDVFCDEVSAPVVAITGSNGKSTVTTLLGEMAGAAGVRVKVGGNLGTPVLDLLDDAAQLYVVELSSFQLETTRRLNAAAATILNLSQDHMDRYPDMLSYHLAKIRVFFGCGHAVMNKEDVLAQAPAVPGMGLTWFTSQRPERGEFGVIRKDDQDYLACGDQALLAVRDMRIKGTHNWANALAALALAAAVDLPLAPCLAALRTFTGLAHRCEWVAEKQGVSYFNDSKATNVGATLAALQGFARAFSGRLILIAGGQGKNQEFTPLHAAINAQVFACILLGTDAPMIRSGLLDQVEVQMADSMASAVALASSLAREGDVVLLSPACASFDMFRDYQDRGDSFRREVLAS